MNKLELTDTELTALIETYELVRDGEYVPPSELEECIEILESAIIEDNNE
jgi:hypothetical protein